MTERLNIQSSAEAPVVVADWVKECCVHAGLEGTPTFQVMTCVVEAVNNCVEHAYRDSPGEINIRLFRNSRWLVVQVLDQGPPLAQQTAPAEPDPIQIDGRGWFIMKQWMDIAQYRRRNLQNVVTLVKCLE
jgi:anti-sigma regulatory factor (Ser/Thr protein kinase)